jgi:hypothetical protein
MKPIDTLDGPRILLQGADEVRTLLSEVPPDRHDLALLQLEPDVEYAADLDTVSDALGALVTKASTRESRAFADELGAHYLGLKYSAEVVLARVVDLQAIESVATQAA